MPDVFSSNPGKIVAVYTDNNYQFPLGVSVADLKTSMLLKGIVVNMSMDGQSGYQVIHTLRQYIYIYTFGERVGELTISGLASVGDCKDSQTTGLKRLYDWYENNRISTTGAPIDVSVAYDLSFSAFLLGFKFQIEDPSINLGAFMLKMIYIPRYKRIVTSTMPYATDPDSNVDLTISDAVAVNTASTPPFPGGNVAVSGSGSGGG